MYTIIVINITLTELMQKAKAKKKNIVSTPPIPPIVDKKLSEMITLKKQIALLKGQLSELKQEMLDYVEKNPQLTKVKYKINDSTVQFTSKNVSDTMSQKLIVSGLIQYFKSKGVSGQNVNTEIIQIIEFIKNERTTKSVPHIDFKLGGTCGPPNPWPLTHGPF